jgi:hypothetical protein
MARERWFYAQGNQRRGPVPFTQLVESVLAQPDPRAAFVWRKGFADWTRAEDVPEVERRVAPFLARKEAEEAARRAPASAPVPAAVVPARPAPTAPGSPALVYGGIAAGVVVIGLLAWLLWPSSRPAPPPQPMPLGGTTAENAPAVVIPAPTGGGATGGAGQGGSAPEGSAPGGAAAATPAPVVSARPAPTPVAAVVGNREADLPPSEVRKLRGVAAWAGDTLKLTVYNGTSWRVTEIYVRIGRFRGDDFVEDPRPLLLLPPGGQVDAGVADLMNKVAPDRKKPGLNPLDTGPFQGRAGQQPDNFRWEIETARGYAPR